MKLSRFLLGVVLCLCWAQGHAEQTAAARLWCTSLRFQGGQDPNGEYLLELTTLSAGINGELAPDYGGAYTHSTWVELTDQWFGDTLPGVMFLNVPDVGDGNGNGWNDFFEVSQPMNASSSGSYSISQLGSGSIQASWWRAAGSHTGTCVLKFKPNPYYTWTTFTHSFEILEYAGPVSYTPGSNTVACTVVLTQNDGGDQFIGPIVFAKNSTNRFDELTLAPGAWTNAAAQTLTYMEDLYFRDAGWPTNYYGYFDFDDGDPTTGEPDYYTWILSIDDLNDADRDGIPDFSDDPAATTPPRRPKLWLALSGNQLQMQISGDSGHSHEIQAASSASSPDWQTVTSLTLTNDPQTVALPLPQGSTLFWRVKAQ